MYTENRKDIRVPMERDVLHFINDRPFRSTALNLSPNGLYLSRKFEPYSRKTRTIQLEIPVPEASELVWAKGEIIYDAISPKFHGLGVRLTAMAGAHERIIDELVKEIRNSILQRMLREVRLKRELSLALPRIQAPPPPPRFERTLVGYLNRFEKR